MSDVALHTRALLVSLTIRMWTARKYDKAVTRDVTASHGATGDAARVNKLLLPGDCPEYRKLTTLMGSMRAEHYARTLAWSDDGARVLPTAGFMAYADWYRTKAAEVQEARDEFVAAYPLLREEERVRMGGLFKDADYPSTIDVSARFECNVQYWPVPATGDLRVDLASDQIAAIEASIGDRLQAATAGAMADAWGRLHDAVAKMSERLNDPEAVFRDTLVDNVRAVVGALKTLNVTNSPELETLRARAEADLTAHDADTLRESDSTRKDTAAKADAILAAMAGLYSPAEV